MCSSQVSSQFITLGSAKIGHGHLTAKIKRVQSYGLQLKPISFSKLIIYSWNSIHWFVIQKYSYSLVLSFALSMVNLLFWLFVNADALKFFTCKRKIVGNLESLINKLYFLAWKLDFVFFNSQEFLDTPRRMMSRFNKHGK